MLFVGRKISHTLPLRVSTPPSLHPSQAGGSVDGSHYWQYTSFSSRIQWRLLDKCLKISILLSHLCELIPVGRFCLDRHNPHQHFHTNFSTLISSPSSGFPQGGVPSDADRFLLSIHFTTSFLGKLISKDYI